MRLLPVLAASSALPIAAQYNGPFTQLSTNGLDGTSDATTGFGA